MKINNGKRNDVELRKKYQAGEISADEFLDKLFSTNEADRRRKRIVEKNEKFNRKYQRA